MKEIPLGRSNLRIQVDDADYENLTRHKWRISNNDGKLYGLALIDGKRTLMHRFLLKLKQGELADHIDGNGLNNQRANLRPCNASENARNRPGEKNSSSPFKGIFRHRKKWQAAIKVNYKIIPLGTYSDPEDAARAYDAAAQKYFGDFAWLNFPVGQPSDAPAVRAPDRAGP